jgi:NodT family efflux transporter outer membrane factor (OMF) lipoprotein
MVACAEERPFAPPPKLPAAFAAQSAASGASATSATSAAGWPSQDWYREFGSETLDALMASAAQGNLNLEAARARVAQADARARQAGAARYPSLDANGSGTYFAGHSSQGSGHEFDWSALLSASYELDFWHKNRASEQSALQLANASRGERDSVALTTLSAVASTYFQALALQERLSIAESNRDAAQKLLAVVQARFDAGAASPVELATQKSTYDGAQIAIFELRQSRAESINALSLLLGQLPEEFHVPLEPIENLREPQVAPGLPSELLTRRADIFVAETQLRSARADVAVARAALFPSISLTASAGIANPALPATVLTIPGVGPTLALGGNLTQPIFNHGKLKAQHDEALAKETELLSNYRASIIAAFGDVENALSALQHLNESESAQRENLSQSDRAFEGAKARYEVGSGDFLTLLEAQRTLYAVRDQFVQYRLARLQALVNLCKALGGGWQSQPSVAASIAQGHP